MIFWKSKANKLHPIPKFPSSVEETFEHLCANITEPERKELEEALGKYLAYAFSKSKKNVNFDLKGAEELVSLGYFLLVDEYPNRTADEQALIVGAVRYFAIGDDPFDDETFATGLHDDKCIMNHVLEELGIEDRYIFVE